MKRRNWFYDGDINIENGGAYYTLDNLKYGYFDAVEVTPGSHAGCQDNAWWVSTGSVNIPTDNDTLLKVLGDVLDCNKRKHESLHWLLTEPGYEHVLFAACHAYGGVEPDRQCIVQIGPKDEYHDGDFLVPDYTLKSNASLERWVKTWRNQYG